MEVITERLLIIQEWYETETTKTGWDSYGWQSTEFGDYIDINNGWEIVEIIDSDKFGNPILAVAEKQTNIL